MSADWTPAARVQPDWKPDAPIRDPAVFDWFHAQGFLCLVCGTDQDVNAAHLYGRGKGGDDVKANLVPLCGSGSFGCHGAYDNGHSHIVEIDVKITPELVRLTIGRWLRSDDGSDARWYLTGKLGLLGAKEWARRQLGTTL